MCSGGTNSALPELSVCTIEKAAALVNALLAEGAEEELGCVLVDVTHMLIKYIIYNIYIYTILYRIYI
jgi:hypothetical protein